MRLIVDVYNAQGEKIGIVPQVKSASITRILDGAGSVRIEALLTDARALELLTNGRRVRVYVEEREEALREIGSGIIRGIKTSATNGGYALSIDGVDSLDELKQPNTLFNRAYEDMTVEAIAKSLAGLALWDAEVEVEVGSKLIDIRFDAVSALKALQTLTEKQDLHLRLSNKPGTIEIGRFGEEIPLRLINVETLPYEAYSNPNIAFIESIAITEDTEALANRLFPLGAGQNVDAAVTLEHSGRSNPYDIRFLYGPDNRKMWYIEDEDSVVQHGLIERVVTFKEIAPLANSTVSKRRASNMLYDSAKAWLRKNAKQVNSFNVALKKCEQTLRPGDKVRMTYKGVIEKDGVPFTYREFNHVAFWVTKVTENVGVEGKTVRVTLSNIDRHADSVARTIVGTLEQLGTHSSKAQPSFNQATHGPYQKEIDPAHSVTVPLVISDTIHTLDLCRLRIRTEPLRAIAVNEDSDLEVGDDAIYPGWLKITVNGQVVAEKLGTSTQGIQEEYDITAIINAGELWATHTILIECKETDSRGVVEVEFDLFTTILPQLATGEMVSGGFSNDRSVSPSFGAGDSAGIVNAKVKVSGADTTEDHLYASLQAGNGITLAIESPGADEKVSVTVNQGQLALGSLGTRAIDDLSDVVLSGAADGQLLQRSGGNWVNVDRITILPGWGAKAHNAATIAIPTTTWTDLTFDTEGSVGWDSDNIHSVASNTQNFTVPVAGKYLCICEVSWAANATGQRLLRVTQGGVQRTQADEINLSATAFEMQCVWVINCAASDVLVFQAWQNTGGNLNVTNLGAYGIAALVQWIGN